MISHIRVIDFETTGTEPPAAEIVEVGLCDLDAERGAVGEPRYWLCGAVNGIPAETRAVHHIAPAEVAGCAVCDLAAIVQEARVWDVHAFAAHNAAFECLWMRPEVLAGIPVICTYKAALRVWPEAPRHSNGVLRYWLEERGELTLDYDTAMPPHRAGPDAYVTAHILKALLKHASAEEMVAWTAEPKLMPSINFGKHRGCRWPDAPSDYLQWIMRSDMDADTKWNADRELRRRSGRS